MISSPVQPLRALILVIAAALLTACQSMPVPSGFSPAQVAVLESQGFVEGDGGWSLTLAERLLFAVDDSALKQPQVAAITDITRRLVSVGIVSARVEGHSDATGTAAYNLALSQARAQAVAAPMIAAGMALTPDQIVGRGETLPLSSNATAEGRQDNRRVVVIVTP